VHRFSVSNPTLESYIDDGNQLKRSVKIGNGSRRTLPLNWYFDGDPQPDVTQFHNIKIVRLSESDNYKNPPSIVAHWEGFGYEVFNADARSFSNFKIKRNFDKTNEWRDFDPAVQHLICQAKAFDMYGGAIDKEKTQRFLDSCRLRNNLPKIDLVTNKTIR